MILGRYFSACRKGHLKTIASRRDAGNQRGHPLRPQPAGQISVDVFLTRATNDVSLSPQGCLWVIVLPLFTLVSKISSGYVNDSMA